jgi:hypothetical protein
MLARDFERVLGVLLGPVIDVLSALFYQCACLPLSMWLLFRNAAKLGREFYGSSMIMIYVLQHRDTSHALYVTENPSTLVLRTIFPRLQI